MQTGRQIQKYPRLEELEAKTNSDTRSYPEEVVQLRISTVSDWVRIQGPRTNVWHL
jgi:hypothetical protein